jgi:hypothetical protein
MPNLASKAAAAGPFGVADATSIVGGTREVADITARNAIPAYVRTKKMVVRVHSDGTSSNNTDWQYNGADGTADNAQWTDKVDTAPVSAPGRLLNFNSNYFVDVRDFYTGTLTYVSPYTSTTYTARQAAPDITAAINLAIAEATTRLGTGLRVVCVKIPAGLYTLSSTITLPSGVIIEGHGSGIYDGSTHLRRTGNYGDTFAGNVGGAAGTFVANAGLGKLRIYQDHGGNSMWGYLNPVAASFVNKVTTGVHINWNFPKECLCEDLSLWGMTGGISSAAGTGLKLRNIEINGIWDSLSSARQEGTGAGVLIDGDLTVGIPTSFEVDHVTINGDKVSGQSLSYPGSHAKTTVLNQGFKDGFVIKCAEEMRVNGLYIQGMAQNGLVFDAKPSSIIAAIKFTNSGFDPCGIGTNDAQVRFRDAGVTSATPAGISFVGCQILGQGNGYAGLSDRGSTASRVSVASLAWYGGEMSTFIGNAVHLDLASVVTIACPIRAFNNDNFYTGDDAAGVYIGAGCNSVSIGGAIGGTSGGSPSGSNCIDGVRAANASASRVTVHAVNAGLSGNLFASGGNAVAIDPPVDGVTLLGDANMTFTYGSTPQDILQSSTLTANRTVTLSTTDIWGAPIPRGTRFCMSRAGGGAFSLTISGVATLAQGDRIELAYYAGWQIMSRGWLSSTYVPISTAVQTALDAKTTRYKTFTLHDETSFTYNWVTDADVILINSALTTNQTITMATSGVPTGAVVRFVRSTGATGAYTTTASGVVLSVAGSWMELTYYNGAGWVETGFGYHTGLLPPISTAVQAALDAKPNRQIGIALHNDTSFTYNWLTDGDVYLLNSPLTANQTVTLSTTSIPHGAVATFVRTASATGAFDAIVGGVVMSAADMRCELTYYTGVGWIKTDKHSIA